MGRTTVDESVHPADRAIKEVCSQLFLNGQQLQPPADMLLDLLARVEIAILIYEHPAGGSEHALNRLQPKIKRAMELKRILEKLIPQVKDTIDVGVQVDIQPPTPVAIEHQELAVGAKRKCVHHDHAYERNKKPRSEPITTDAKLECLHRKLDQLYSERRTMELELHGNSDQIEEVENEIAILEAGQGAVIHREVTMTDDDEAGETEIDGQQDIDNNSNDHWVDPDQPVESYVLNTDQMDKLSTLMPMFDPDYTAYSAWSDDTSGTGVEFDRQPSMLFGSVLERDPMNATARIGSDPQLDGGVVSKEWGKDSMPFDGGDDQSTDRSIAALSNRSGVQSKKHPATAEDIRVRRHSIARCGKLSNRTRDSQTMSGDSSRGLLKGSATCGVPIFDNDGDHIGNISGQQLVNGEGLNQPMASTSHKSPTEDTESALDTSGESLDSISKVLFDAYKALSPDQKDSP